jgi:hypothetical protein
LVDQSFFLRAKRLLAPRPAALSHQALLARLAEQRAAAPTVQACAEPAPTLGDDSELEALAVLLLAEPGWRVAARIQRGCFNRAEAARGVNTL